jgi:hypothetical protein
MAAGTKIPACPAIPSPQDDLFAAFQRAVAERLHAEPTDDPGVWECSGYTIAETGPRPLDVLCCCPDSRYRGRLCKHAVAVVAARRRGQIRRERWCLQCDLNPVVEGFLRCLHCAGRSHMARWYRL